MLKSSKSNLSKLELLFQEQGYTLRYEKGNFNSGYCLVDSRKIIIVNKFYDVEARINVLLDILYSTVIMESMMSEKILTFYKNLIKSDEFQVIQSDLS